MPRTLPPSLSYFVLALSAGMVTYAMKGFSLFSILFLSPFAALAVAAAIAKRNVIVRFAVMVGMLFLALDGFLLYGLLTGSGSSTDAVSLGVVTFLQLLVISPIVAAAIIVGRGRWRHGRNIV
jgi:hypothetical protein